MTNTAPITDRSSMIEHDRILLDLLRDVATAHRTLDRDAGRLLDAAATARVSHTGDASMDDPDRPYQPRRCRREDLPEGLLYYRSKTFRRGEEGFYVVGPPSTTGAPRLDRRATTQDALDRLDPDHRAVVAYEAARSGLVEARRAVAAHEEDYTGWARFFLVTSSAGHVHSSMNCSTCRPATTYAPVVDLSGATERDAVETLGETLCSVCFPSAPVEGRPSKITKAAAKKLLGG